MPTYTYTCTACNDVIEKRRSFSDPPLTSCEQCGGTLRKIIHPVGIVFKGSGWYVTDSRPSTTAPPSPPKTGSDGSATPAADGAPSANGDGGKAPSAPSTSSGAKDGASSGSTSPSTASSGSAPAADKS